jgi:hypothetical protein
MLDLDTHKPVTTIYSDGSLITKLGPSVLIIEIIG